MANIFSEADFTQANSEFLEEVPYNGSLMEDVKTTLIQNRDVQVKVDVFKREFEHFRKVDAAWKNKMESKTNLILAALGCTEQEEPESQSLLTIDPDRPPSAVQKATPFVTIAYVDGKVEDVYIAASTVRDVLSCGKTREMVRKLLLNFHSIPQLRTFTLSGRSYSNTAVRKRQQSAESQQSEIEPVKKVQLPIRTRLIIMEALQRYTSFTAEVLKNEGLMKAKREDLQKTTKECITNVLNYFYSSYDPDGIMIVDDEGSKRAKQS